ncbi:MAG: complex I NDUFA9 subunit family protein [Methylophilales bacterium]|nr:complex I NDUFA9 subunit family protein [Methylophilales bacterium]
MQRKTVCVLGGSGFIGSHIVHHLDKAGFDVKVLTRRRESSKHLILLPKVTVIECQIMSDMALRHALSGCDAVINLVGILHQDRHATFEAIHSELPRRLVGLCKELGINRFIQMSALHASSAAPSMYLRSKAVGEAAVKVSQLNWTIFRPSVVFGEGDSFLNLFARMAKLTPIIPLAVPNARFQPIWVEDLAKVIAASVDDLHTYHQSYDLCGPTIYTMRELVAFAAKAVGANPRIIGLNQRLSYLQAMCMEWLPIKLMSRDNLRSTEIDSISTEPFPALFGIMPTSLEAVAPHYLSGTTPRANYLRYRVTAGR